MNLMLFRTKNKLSSEEMAQFSEHIINTNLSRIKILLVIALIIEPILAILFLLNVFNGDQIILKTIIFISIFALLVLCLTYLLKNKSLAIKKHFIVVSVNMAIYFAIFTTNLLLSTGNNDVSLLLIVIFAISILVVTEPIWAIFRYLGALIVFTLLLVFNNYSDISQTILINTTAFVFIAVVCSTIIYNDELKIFMEKIELDKVQKELEHMSNTDQLTGLNNRRKIDTILNIEAKNNNDANYFLSVILIDIDFFKEINDAYGHLVGDEVLKDFSAYISSKISPTDIVGRWGGEEFIIICKNTNHAQAIEKANALKCSINNHLFPHDIQLTASMGVSCINKIIEPTTLLRNADQALYSSKDNGRNRIESII